MHLPIQDSRNQPVTTPTSRDIGDSINRCRAKAVAMVNGVGLSLYAGYGDNVVGFIKALGVKPDTEDLSSVQPLLSQKGGRYAKPYLSWAAALAAMRITDPDSYWELEYSEFTDPETGEIVKAPVFRAGSGWMVGVTIHWRGISHTEWLPVMGVREVMTKNGPKKLDHQPITDPNINEWNTAVMRCLAKGIAIATGYGISVYAKEDIESLKAEVIGGPAQQQPKPVVESPVTTAPPETVSSVQQEPAVEQAAVTQEPPQIPNSEQIEMVRKQILSLKEVPEEDRRNRLAMAVDFVERTFQADQVALDILAQALEEVASTLPEAKEVAQ
ncbi:DUF1071 domain-containing protein [Candidatus Parcubacteria bacterium]|nr:MAG: DUF1071 domain-containing protein [Candidatus Parcubacteria bacterium]